MLDISQLPEQVQKQIEKIAGALEMLDGTAPNRKVYKKEYDMGVPSNVSRTEKVKPAYSIDYCVRDKWENQVNRYKNIEQFRSLVLEIIENFEPDFVRVFLYKNDARNDKKSGKQTHIIVLNEAAEVPKDELKVLAMDDIDTHTEDFEKLENFRSVQMLLEKLEAARDKQELGAVEGVQKEMGFQLQLQGLRNDNEIGMVKMEVSHKMDMLGRDYKDVVKEANRLKEDYEKVKKELEESEDEINDLQTENRDKQMQIDALMATIQQNERADARTKRAINIGGMLAGTAIQRFATTPKFKKVLDGFIKDCEKAFDGIQDDEIIPIHKEVEGTLVEEPTTEEGKYQKALSDWIYTIDKKEALQILMMLAENLSNGKTQLQEVYELCETGKGGTNGKV